MFPLNKPNSNDWSPATSKLDLHNKNVWLCWEHWTCYFFSRLATCNKRSFASPRELFDQNRLWWMNKQEIDRTSIGEIENGKRGVGGDCENQFVRMRSDTFPIVFFYGALTVIDTRQFNNFQFRWTAHLRSSSGVCRRIYCRPTFRLLITTQKLSPKSSKKPV